VFDAAKIGGGVLTVRLARGGERIEALNGKDYELAPGMVAIDDDRGTVSLGGVMGGTRTGVDEGTTDVFLEAALFDPLRTAATGRRLGVQSDARFRFERGVDPAAVFDGVEAATRLILEICGGEPSELVVAGQAPDVRREIRFRPARVASLGGVAVPGPRAIEILAALGFETSGTGEDLAVVPPSWRRDVEGEADLVEEVLRIEGFDKIPATPLPPTGPLPSLAIDPLQKRTALARRALAARGMVEAVTWSFMPRDKAELFGGGQESLRLANPISSDLDQMRPSVLPNLIAAVTRNADRGFADLALFEVGPAYRDITPDGQDRVAAGIRSGNAVPRTWSAPVRAVDPFDVKADVLALLAELGVPTANLAVAAEAPAWYHPGRSAVLKLGPKAVLARFGELHPAVLQAFDVGVPVMAFEVMLDVLPQPKARAGRARPLLKPPAFQAVERDFAFLVAADVAADAVARAARLGDKELITRVGVFDVYQGKGMPEGMKSVAISVALQPTDRTLTDAEIEAVAARVVASVVKATGGTLRG
jgi:phenylalanyl-tRNA synthetase beta chain